MSNLLLIPLDDVVLFPGMTVTIAADVGDEDEVLIVPRTDDEYGDVGTVAEVVESGRLPGGAHAATVRGLTRGVPGVASTGPDGRLRVEVAPQADPALTSDEHEQVREQEREYRAVVEEILELRGADERIRGFLRSI